MQELHERAATVPCAQSLPNESKLKHVLIIVVCGILFRALYLYTFKPAWSADTFGYWMEFFQWAKHTFSFAERPPMYSLFLGGVQRLTGEAAREEALTTSARYLCVVIQSALGVVCALLVYFGLRSLKVPSKVALAGGIAFSVTGAVCLFEILLLSEALSLFFLTLGTWAVLRCVSLLRDGGRFVLPALVGGVSLSSAALTRPENLIFAIMLIVALAVLALRTHFVAETRATATDLAKLSALLLISFVPLVFLWMSWNLLTIGIFRMNTLTGVTRTESVYNLFDKLDGQDKVTGQILRTSYLQMNGNGRVYRHHVWVAMPYLLRAAQQGAIPVVPRENAPKNPTLLKLRAHLFRALGITGPPTMDGRVIRQPIALFDYLGGISGKLARNYPARYLHNVADNFFEDTFNYSYPPFSINETENPQAPEGGSVVRSRTTHRFTVWISWIEAPLLTACYLALLACVLAAPWLLLKGKGADFLNDGAVIALAIAAFATIAATCVVAAYYPEHGVPFFGVYMICAFYLVGNMRRARSFRRSLSQTTR